MKSLWNQTEADSCGQDLLKLRVYTSRLLGQNPDLVLHGGGNTSVKATIKDDFGQSQDVLYVKGSGWDLATIEAEGFAPVKLEPLQRMAEFETLSDGDMVRIQRSLMTNPYAPNPSVEAILHAIIPFTFVDHTHADAVVAVTNTPIGLKRINKIYGDRVLVVPYIMPGFVLARKVYEMTRDTDWSKLDGIILMNHGIFTFHEDAKKSYELMIELVSKAEDYLKEEDAFEEEFKVKPVAIHDETNLLQLAQVRKAVSQKAGQAMLARWKTDGEHVHYSDLPNLSAVATRGPLTPDHVIRTKRIPVILTKDPLKSINQYEEKYLEYFKMHKKPELTCLDTAPRWAVWSHKGTVCFSPNIKGLNIIDDITQHTIKAIQWSEYLGGWKALSAQDVFDVEYWELEQAKLAKAGKPSVFSGKVALVTGAATGIGKACVDNLVSQGAVVVALDIDAKILETFTASSVLPLICDVTSEEDVQKSIDHGIREFGGLDIIVSNAGIFPPSASIGEMKSDVWEKSLQINLTAHQRLFQLALPYLEHGLDPAIVIIGSKNVPAPGPGAAAYSVAKAGLTQLARIAALEFGEKGVRVNTVHPNQVFDTALWTPEVLKQRAKHYGLTVEEYKTNNLLRTEITSQDVARMVSAMAGPIFSKTTGSQVPIDGGNDRVI